MMRGAFRFVLAIVATQAQALDESALRFAENNQRALIHHELGHALIDLFELRIFGQEEDAADGLAAYLNATMLNESDAVEMVYDVALGFQAEAAWTEKIDGHYPLTAVHGPDLQRMYNHICIFVGQDMDDREDIGRELGLDDDRLDYCEQEFAMSAFSWGSVMERLTPKEYVGQLLLTGSRGAKATVGGKLISKQVKEFNAAYALPRDILVKVKACGEPNAFYDADRKRITLCTEFAADQITIFDDF